MITRPAILAIWSTLAPRVAPIAAQETISAPMSTMSSCRVPRSVMPTIWAVSPRGWNWAVSSGTVAASMAKPAARRPGPGGRWRATVSPNERPPTPARRFASHCRISSGDSAAARATIRPSPPATATTPTRYMTAAAFAMSPE